MSAVLIAAAPAAALAGPADRYYERSFVLAANERCGLFQPQLTSALTAAAWQARGAALRAGANDRDVAETAARARARAASTDCGSADLKTVSGRVETAFAGWSRTSRMTFPGERASWSADRAAYSRPTWRLMQATTTGASPVRVGVVGGLDRPDQLTAVVSWHGRPRPTGVADADAGLLAEGRDAGQAWTFPAAAAAALSGLDPREVFTVEFVFRDGSIATSTFEAGDFAAGRAFLAMGRV